MTQEAQEGYLLEIFSYLIVITACLPVFDELSSGCSQ